MQTERFDITQLADEASQERIALIDLADIILFEEESARKSAAKRQVAYKFNDAVRALYAAKNKMYAVLEIDSSIRHICIGEVALGYHNQKCFPVMLPRKFVEE